MAKDDFRDFGIGLDLKQEVAIEVIQAYLST
jgi:hypothetical protein